jgi:hypothetical protein
MIDAPEFSLKTFCLRESYNSPTYLEWGLNAIATQTLFSKTRWLKRLQMITHLKVYRSKFIGVYLSLAKLQQSKISKRRQVVELCDKKEELPNIRTKIIAYFTIIGVQ